MIDDRHAHAFLPYPDAPVPHAGDGAVAGLCFAAKDLFDVAGHPTSGGSPTLLALSGIKTRNAPAVQRLLDAGARCVGKTVTGELAFSLNGPVAGRDGAPMGLSLIGPRGSDLGLVALACKLAAAGVGR